MIKWPFLISILIFCTGCETAVELELPEVTPQIIINSVFNADSVVTVNLTKSRASGSIGSEFEKIENAEVTFYKNNQKLGQMQHEGNGNYRFAGLTANDPAALYAVKVDAPGFRMAEGGEVMPKRPLISSYSTPPYTNSNFTYKDFKISLILNDTQEDNFYFIRAFLKSQVSKNIIYAQIKNNLGQFSPVGTREAAVFTDKLFNGKLVLIELEISNLLVPQGPHSIAIEVGNMSKSYYDYEYSVKKQLGNDPLFGQEYIPVNSNIKNGLGIFAAYNSTTFSFEVKR